MTSLGSASTLRASTVRALTFAVLAIVWFAAVPPGFSQTEGTGAIQGRVYNSDSREYINNAEVRLEGTNQVTYTESDGSFKFAQVAPSVATFAVTYTGYNSARETFAVASGQTAVREISLSSTAASAAKPDVTTKLDAFTRRQVQIAKFDSFRLSLRGWRGSGRRDRRRLCRLLRG